MHVHLHLPHPHHQQSGDAPANPLGLRARVWSHQFELDRDLAAGALPDRSPEHEARARQLLSDRCRRQLLAELDSALLKADHPPHWHSASLPVQTVSEQRAALATRRRARIFSPERSSRPGLQRLARPHGRATRPGRDGRTDPGRRVKPLLRASDSKPTRRA